jgi:outer membrane protein assembly factor BamB
MVCIAQGMGYINLADGVHCIDMATGKTLWIAPGSVNNLDYAQARSEASSAEGFKPSLIPLSIGTTLTQYDPITGAVTLNQTNFLAANSFVPPWAYSVVNYGNTSAPNYKLVCWSPANTANITIGTLSTGAYNLATATLYNVTWPFSGLTIIGTTAQGVDVGIFVNRNDILPGWVGCADLVTGALMWNSTMSYRSYSTGSTVAAYGKVITLGDNGYWDCFDLATGKKLWTSDTPVYPYGFAWAYNAAAAYGNFYGFAYNGVYCYDSNTGHIKWVFNLGNSNGETPYNTWPYDGPCAIGDGKLYIANGIHTPPTPLERGDKMVCIDANTGQQLWNVSFQSFGPGGSGYPGKNPLLADGYLVQANANDGILYCFHQGQTATTASAPQTTITQGQSIVVTGTVLDQSPAQPGTPCVSDASMTTWMEYLHMQLPIPANVTITGVPVSLDAVDPNGNFVHITTVTTDGASGTFGFTWAPTIAGQYQITATYAGDDSYGSSSATTYASVVAPTATSTVAPVNLATTNDLMTYMVAGVIAIIIAIAIVGLLILRKHP